MLEVPQRLSVDDVDYDPRVGESLTVYLDGIDQRYRATAYDIAAGTVTRCKYTADGKPYNDGDEIAMETVHGIVTVTRR